MTSQQDLFGAAPPALPAGMRYETDFLSRDEELHWIAFAQAQPLAEMNYKGYQAKRRVVSFGGKYDYMANRLNEGPPIPPGLDGLRGKVARWLGVAPEAFTQVLVAEYREGTPLGWHRDVPDFEDVVGVSLLSGAVMRFRPYPPDAPKRSDIVKLDVQPRSIYLLRGVARWEWQHSVAPTKMLRYSITFRTPRERR
ncbi:MAG TPA: alpha-ketoglutarate-dependent dioxygenase AlkB [Ramlibacter sp.]